MQGDLHSTGETQIFFQGLFNSTGWILISFHFFFFLFHWMDSDTLVKRLYHYNEDDFLKKVLIVNKLVLNKKCTVIKEKLF